MSDFIPEKERSADNKLARKNLAFYKHTGGRMYLFREKKQKQKIITCTYVLTVLQNKNSENRELNKTEAITVYIAITEHRLMIEYF